MGEHKHFSWGVWGQGSSVLLLTCLVQGHCPSCSNKNSVRLSACWHLWQPSGELSMLTASSWGPLWQVKAGLTQPSPLGEVIPTWQAALTSPTCDNKSGAEAHRFISSGQKHITLIRQELKHFAALKSCVCDMLDGCTIFHIWDVAKSLALAVNRWLLRGNLSINHHYMWNKSQNYGKKKQPRITVSRTLL